MAGVNNFSTQHDFLVFIAEFPEVKFTSLSGGQVRREKSTVHAGGDRTQTNVYGPDEVDDIQLEAPYDPVRFAKLDLWDLGWRKGVRLTVTLVKQPVTSAGIPTGKAEKWLRCGNGGYNTPDVSSGSAQVANMTLTLSPEEKV